jgi:DHA1 family inner membrane transport protein
MFGGLTVSNVIGVPLGTFLGQQLGWRSTFWALVVIGVITLLGIRLLVPPTPVPAETSLRSELRAFRRPQVWVSVAISVLAFAGVIGAFTYIAFTVTRVSGFATSSVPWLLVLFGLGTLAGNFVGGKVADRALNTSLVVIMALLTVVLGVFALTAENKVMTILSLLLMGGVGLATAPGLQLRTMKFAPDAPIMASGANIAAFNVGNALGAWLGGLALAAGFGFVSPLWVGAGLVGTGLVVLAAGSVWSTGDGEGRRRPARETSMPINVPTS